MKRMVFLVVVLSVIVISACRSAPETLPINAPEITETQSDLAQVVTETTETTSKAVEEAVELVSIVSSDSPAAKQAAKEHLLTMNNLAATVFSLGEKEASARAEVVRLLHYAGITEKAYYTEKEERKRVATQRNVAIACFIVTLVLMALAAYKRLHPFQK